MTLQQLHYVVALDNYRHFVKAAESCFVAQPTLTLQVKKLEDEIGLVIFDRSSKPLTPTYQGEKFILKARQIIREVEGLKEMVNDDRQSLTGICKIGIIPTLSPYLIPLFLKSFSDAHPDLQLEINEMQSDDILANLDNGKLDIGMLVVPTQQRNIREVKLFSEPFMYYADEKNKLLHQSKLFPEDLDEKGLWLLDQGHCFRDQVLNICNRLEKTSAENRIKFKTGSLETLKKMILSHTGYTLLPELSVTSNDEKYVKKFENPQPARQIGLAVHKSFTKELLLKNLRDAILEVVPSHFHKTKEFITVKWR
ncbi:LysR family transcriptional regulator, hydrogen peroxide-inducible genes activator [Mesonia phycicola]|uniref:LysR family transcriptional regulator, hydrogen peroxide-inducible genes activator n=1 Tax=Mesonia phycicola TaxID=579105 RepID=A0A1M6AC14_9FLAO|nr:LysR substrate-binding domain-containing protein [Mesonia phycicola]SHI33928.1 LysR family transcriptional regulator, hydrogen peroxide-inducible genes activator [Mesonia phycicola]